MEVNQALTLGFACFTETAMLHHAFTTFLERNDVKAKYYWLAFAFICFLCFIYSWKQFFYLFRITVLLFTYSIIFPDLF